MESGSHSVLMCSSMIHWPDVLNQLPMAVPPANHVSCMTFLDNRPADPSNDRALSDLNNRLPDTTRRLPEDSVHPRVSVHVRPPAASAYTASSGASGPGMA